MIGDRIRNDVPLGPHTTLGVGGPARHYLRAERESDVGDGLAWAAERALPVLALGGGSNLLVSDEGFGGLVIEIALYGVHVEPLGGGRVLVRAAAGEGWDELVARTVAADLAGLECLSGIPGRVGATPIQNVGAYGQEVAETIRWVRAFDRTTGAVVELAPSECAFRYRSSVFKQDRRDRYWILEVAFELARGGAPARRYPELVRALGDERAGLSQVRETVLALRRAKSMVIDAADPESRSAGSFFLNPVLASAELAALVRRGRASGALGPSEEPPTFEVDGGRSKIPAAWLIERAGSRKGEPFGGARISRRHALALVNGGAATAADLAGLAARVQDRVRAAFAVELAIEPVLVGFASPA